MAVSEKSKRNDKSTNLQIRLSAEQIGRGNIKMDTIGKEIFGDKLLLTGILNFNQDKLSYVKARVEELINCILKILMII